MMQATFGMIKSGALERGHRRAIVLHAQSKGLHLTASRRFNSVAFARALYESHQDKPYFRDLLDSVTGPHGAYGFILTGESAIAAWRDLMGATDSRKAAKGTLRSLYGGRGELVADNAVHGSDTPENALREIALFLSGVV